jgi:hypothetical protein
MDIHKNARLTLRSREALFRYAACGLRLRAVAASFHVTPKTAAKWGPVVIAPRESPDCGTDLPVPSTVPAPLQLPW